MEQVKNAWLCPALGVGLYEGAMTPADVERMEFSSVWNEHNSHPVHFLGQGNEPSSLWCGKKNAFFFVFSNTEQDQISLSEDQLYEYFRRNEKAFFAYEYPIVEEAAPMKLPVRARQDKDLTGLDLEDKIDELRNQNSRQIIKIKKPAVYNL